MKNGDAELGVAGPARRLGPARYLAAVHRGFRPAGQCPASSGKQPVVELQDLREERLLLRTYCEQAGVRGCAVASARARCRHCYQITSEGDLMSMLASDLGVAIVPRSASSLDGLARITINGLDLDRSVHLTASPAVNARRSRPAGHEDAARRKLVAQRGRA